MPVASAEWTDWEKATKGQIFISAWMWSLFQWGFSHFGDWEGCFMFPFPSLICSLICGESLCLFCVCIAGSQDWPLSIWTLFSTLSLGKGILSPEGLSANETTVAAALKKKKKKGAWDKRLRSWHSRALLLHGSSPDRCCLIPGLLLAREDSPFYLKPSVNAG